MHPSFLRTLALLLWMWLVVQPAQGLTDFQSVHFDLEDDADLDWTAGSVLGLQRGYTLHRKGAKVSEEASDSAALLRTTSEKANGAEEQTAAKHGSASVVRKVVRKGA